MQLYHFTVPERERHLGQIIRDGVIRTTSSRGHLPGEPEKPGVVWLRDTPDAVHDGLFYSNGSDAKMRGRITAELEDAERWEDWADRVGVLEWVRLDLVSNGGGDECAEHWYVVERPIEAKDWVAVDFRVADEWVPVVGSDDLPTGFDLAILLGVKPNGGIV